MGIKFNFPSLNFSPVNMLIVAAIIIFAAILPWWVDALVASSSVASAIYHINRTDKIKKE